VGVLDRREDTPALRRQLADAMRGWIETGLLSPGDHLPSAGALAKDYDVHPDTAKAAVGILVHEGLVRSVPRRGYVVAGEDPVRMHPIEGPAHIRVRMPSGPERRDWDIPAGVPLIIIEREDEEGEWTTEQLLGNTTVLEIT
jgi:DNA-binding transcriptional MocR family regulator